MFIDKLIMDKQNVLFTQNRILFRPKKECNSDICYNTDELYTLCKVSNIVIEEQIQHDSAYISYLE